MDNDQKIGRFRRNPKRQILRIESNIQEIRHIFHELRTNSESAYQKVESSVEIVKVIKLLELERQVVEFNEILEEILSNPTEIPTLNQEEIHIVSPIQENTPPETIPPQNTPLATSDEELEEDSNPDEIQAIK